MHIYSNQMARMQKLRNKAMRVILNCDIYEYIFMNEMLDNLKLLNIK